MGSAPKRNLPLCPELATGRLKVVAHLDTFGIFYSDVLLHQGITL